MTEIICILLPVVLPMVMGGLLCVVPPYKKRSSLITYTTIAFILSFVTLLVSYTCYGRNYVVFYLTKELPVMFRVDRIGILFTAVSSLIWILSGIYSFEYMKHEQNNQRYYGFYLLVLGVLNGLAYSSNLVTFYTFYEFLTLSSFMLVLHNQSREAVMAGLKYLFYSFCGAYMALFGLYAVYQYGISFTFTSGGILNMGKVAGNEAFLLLVAFLMLIGFGVKAGMFPMHAWLPTAHPVAPSPASAVLSSIIVKAGVLAILRVIYQIFGTAFLKGTWVQTAFIILACITVFMGSMLAFREKLLKKRLAYSTVSQVSYILLGLAVFQEDAFVGGMLHFVGHALVKCTLFLVAGAIIYKTGCTRVEELRGIGKKMPVTMACFTLAALGLIGVPPTGGFVSKWYLAIGSLKSDCGILAYIIPVILLISALLTAYYLLQITIIGFFPGRDLKFDEKQRCDASPVMLVPMIIISVLSLLIGMFPQGMITMIRAMAAGLLG
ncbi:MAG: complex I subunit 5 family protein [Lachnospiraceae bacterium]